MMKNPMMFYAVIALGVLVLATGVYLLSAHYHGRAYAVVGAGVLLIAAGIAGKFVLKPKVE